MVWIQIHNRILKLVILSSLVWVLVTGFLSIAPAVAAMSQTEEIPGQWLYQSRTVLQDQSGSSWQAIAFKRIRPESAQGVYLRLVGFPESVHIDQTQPLRLTTALGKSLTAPNITSRIFSDTPSLPNVGQYDLHLVLSEFNQVIPLRIEIPTQEGIGVALWVSPQVLQEWHTIAEIP